MPKLLHQIPLKGNEWGVHELKSFYINVTLSEVWIAVTDPN